MKLNMPTVLRALALFAICLGAVLLVATMTGCSRQADRVSYNVSQEADNFNVTRRLVVTNVSMMTSPTVLYELTSNFSINTDNVDGQLEVVSEVHKDGRTIYKKDFVRLNQYVTYVVEDLSGSDVEPYTYEFNYMPELVQTFSIVRKP